MKRVHVCGKWCATVLVVLAALVSQRAYGQQSTNYPPMLLQVPFLCQVPPGTWGGTKNCGQACSAMLAGYYQRYTPAPSAITNSNKWLANRTGDQRYNDPSGNGYYTHFSDGRNSLGSLLTQYHGLRYSQLKGGDVTSILYQLNMGRPVIVGVMVKGGSLTSSGGVAHWAIAVGWNARDGKVILNDPGSSAGRFRQYSVADFVASWSTQGKIYAPVWAR